MYVVVVVQNNLPVGILGVNTEAEAHHASERIKIADRNRMFTVHVRQAEPEIALIGYVEEENRDYDRDMKDDPAHPQEGE